MNWKRMSFTSVRSYHLALVFIFGIFSACGNQEVLSNTFQTDLTDTNLVPKDSFEIEYEIVQAVFEAPPVKARIEQKQKLKPNSSSTTAGIVGRPNGNDTLFYTVVVDDLADDDTTWYTFGIYHVYYPEMRIMYVDTLLNMEKDISDQK